MGCFFRGFCVESVAERVVFVCIERKVSMSEVSLLLKAYYELAYELLEANRDCLVDSVGDVLSEEVAKRGYVGFDANRYDAFREACVAFIDERIEAYNPVGIQYTFERVRAKEAAELEMQLDWHDSKSEFEALVQTARDLLPEEVTDDNLRTIACELLKRCGVYPDRSIISGYEAKPGLNKLPDYIVGRVIEDVIG